MFANPFESSICRQNRLIDKLKRLSQHELYISEVKQNTHTKCLQTVKYFRCKNSYGKYRAIIVNRILWQ